MGGLYIAWKNSQVRKGIRIASENFRLQAVILEYQDCKVLLINTYFPCDSQKIILTNDESVELQNLLNEIASIKEKYAKKFDISIIVGDINFDDSRYTGHTIAINTFLERQRLSSAWDFYPVDFTFSNGQTVSTIDHFFLSNSNILLEGGALHDPDNVSGHSPVYIKIDLIKARNPQEKLFKAPRLNWDRSSPEQHAMYKQQLNDQLEQHEPHHSVLKCDDVLCREAVHLQHIDSFSNELFSAMVDSAWDNLEVSKGTTGDQSSREHTIPGWNEGVKPFQTEARFWYNLWLSAGKPLHSSVPGVEHDLFIFMKSSRNNYHYAIRRTQNNLKSIENDKVVSKMGTPGMFEEIRNVCRNKKSEVTTVVDDVHGAKNISNHFKYIYEQLYNEQGDISQDLILEIDSRVEHEEQKAKASIELVTADLVKLAVKKLIPNKADVSGDFTSDCLKAAPDIFLERLATLFRSCLYHGHISHDLLVCALSPIVKDANGDITSSKNYRGIAISSLILKVFDNCLLLLFGSLLSNDDLQFGFQRGCSTVQCTWAVQETISSYLRKGSEVYCCLLDFSKAFDKVNFDKLFRKLLDRSFPTVFL